jgi:hypothetical protein
VVIVAGRTKQTFIDVVAGDGEPACAPPVCRSTPQAT